ncbi:hypothetical protein N7462_011166 [Penicillium macrosclerotiorum]|uniref:uncharacterized protein n=1 Tax=Penicillium macrosclerotiorum TaxID=303699 RepID=UPI0025487293|nr:uncharacterized protein N7462_011166 [Penicillium macrosclerotiorum]KAJ5666757.1 hypothetical protein N7462_011166 [Penicillium macrosclerotiorum]
MAVFNPLTEILEFVPTSSFQAVQPNAVWNATPAMITIAFVDFLSDLPGIPLIRTIAQIDRLQAN